MAGGSGSPQPRKSWAGTERAPEIPTGVAWFNVQQPLTLADLKGKNVLFDFWTLGCINCQHIIPDLKRLEAEFGDSLMVIGVHSGKYAEEHQDDAIKEAIKRYGLEHPVINDPDFTVWRTYGASAWPTLVLIDPAGNLVGGHAGEGVYELFRPILASLDQEFSAKGEINHTHIPLALDNTAAPTVLSYPGKVLADAKGGKLYIADSGHNRVLIADLNGRLETAIGSGKEGFADGDATEAEFRQPQGLALSSDGKTLYVADTRNHAVRAIDLATNEVTTVAGTGQQLDRLPATGAKARETAMASPWDAVAVGETLYVSMAGVHQIWAMDLEAGTVSVFAGTSREGITDGPRLKMATLAQPSGITTDGHYLYWVDPESSSVRRVALSSEGEAEVETLVGTGLFDYGDDDGQGKAAQIQHAQGIVYGDGALFVSDTYNHKVRALDPASLQLKTLAGDGERGWNDGAGGDARFDEPGGLGFANGEVYIADTNNHLIRVVDPKTGETSSLALSNLAVANPGTPGRAMQVKLNAASVAPGASNMRVRFSAPDGYHLNSQAPSRVTLTSSNPAVVELGESELTWSSDEGEVTLPVPVRLNQGSATVTANASVYYCRSGEEALCFIQQIEISLPVNVDSASSASEVAFDYVLPATPG